MHFMLQVDFFDNGVAVWSPPPSSRFNILCINLDISCGADGITYVFLQIFLEVLIVLAKRQHTHIALWRDDQADPSIPAIHFYNVNIHTSNKVSGVVLKAYGLIKKQDNYFESSTFNNVQAKARYHAQKLVKVTFVENMGEGNTFSLLNDSNHVYMMYTHIKNHKSLFPTPTKRF